MSFLDPQLWHHLKVVLAFATRTSALVVLLLLYIRFAQARGPMSSYFKHATAAWVFLLFWVWCGSIAELVSFIDGASVAVELSANYIFIPNLILTIWVGRLLWQLQDKDKDRRDGG